MRITPQSSAPHAADGGADQLFVRNATGLVRDVGSFTQTVISLSPGDAVTAIGAGVFVSLSLYPGGSIYLGVLLAIPLMLAFSYAFGLLTAAIPRTGGDYTIISRILHPALGVVSSSFQTVADILSLSWLGLSFAIYGLAPAFLSIGLVADSHTLVSWGQTLSTDHTWQWALAGVCVIATSLMLAGNWKWNRRTMLSLLAICMGGLFVCMVIALFTSPAAFQADFNAFARPVTHHGNAYASVIANAKHQGVQTTAAFAFGPSLPYVGVMSGFMIFTYFASFIGGELRRGGSTGTAHRMALGGTINCIIIVLAALIFFRTFGASFLTAANGVGLPGSFPPPYYFFLTSVIVGSPVVAVFLSLSFPFAFVVLSWVTFLQPTRTMFAYAFDGLLPRAVTNVSKRGTPYVTLVITVIATLATNIWAVNAGGTLFKVLTYAILIQVTSMGMIGITAMLFPFRQPGLFRASVSNKRFLGVPVVCIAGFGSVAATIIIYILFIKYPDLGLSSIGTLALWIGVITAIALVFYYSVRAVRLRQGVPIDRVYGEIPPE